MPAARYVALVVAALGASACADSPTTPPTPAAPRVEAHVTGAARRAGFLVVLRPPSALPTHGAGVLHMAIGYRPPCPPPPPGYTFVDPFGGCGILIPSGGVRFERLDLVTTSRAPNGPGEVVATLASGIPDASCHLYRVSGAIDISPALAASLAHDPDRYALRVTGTIPPSPILPNGYAGTLLEGRLDRLIPPNPIIPPSPIIPPNPIIPPSPIRPNGSADGSCSISIGERRF